MNQLRDGGRGAGTLSAKPLQDGDPPVAGDPLRGGTPAPQDKLLEAGGQLRTPPVDAVPVRAQEMDESAGHPAS